jgi:hypothetical protein
MGTHTIYMCGLIQVLGTSVSAQTYMKFFLAISRPYLGVNLSPWQCAILLVLGNKHP